MANPFDALDDKGVAFKPYGNDTPESVAEAIMADVPSPDREKAFAQLSAQLKTNPNTFKQPANPFDALDTPTTPQPSVVNQIPGLENSKDSSRNVGVDNSTLLDKARGAVEAGASLASGIPATAAEAW